jgi:hypothetical protein
VPFEPIDREWHGNSRRAVVIIVLIALISAVPFLVGFLLAPPGMHFTGMNEDIAQHAAWASEMATHFRYQNVLTPEQTQPGWFFNPVEFLVGMLQRFTGAPYLALRVGVVLLCTPVYAVLLVGLARRTGFRRPGLVAVTALLAGSFVEIERKLAHWGLVSQSTMSFEASAAYGHPVPVPELTQWAANDGTPTFGSPFDAYLYMALVLAVLINLPEGSPGDESSGFRRAAVWMAILGIVYPFPVPTLGLTAVLCALLWARQRGVRSVGRGMVWIGCLSGVSMLYWLVLLRVDPEYARFAGFNVIPLLPLRVVVITLGLGLGAVLGIPRLLRGNSYQQMLACATVAFCVALYIPAHPYRPHLFMLAPVLVIAAAAAWVPVIATFPRPLRLATAVLVPILAFSTTAQRYRDGIRETLRFVPPLYLTSGEQAAIRWIAQQPGNGVVGHVSWTRNYAQRKAEVNRAFDNDSNPLPLIKRDQVEWVLVDEDRGTPAWARGVPPVVQFGQTVVLDPKQLANPGTARVLP